MVVCGETLINAVCRNRGGQSMMLYGECTPLRAWSVTLAPLTRLKAICLAWVIEEIDIA